MIITNIRWNTSEDEPIDINAPVLIWTEKNRLMVLKDTKAFLGGDTSKIFSDWMNLVDKYKIKYWVYQGAITRNFQ